jgi:hypothetical protein
MDTQAQFAVDPDTGEAILTLADIPAPLPSLPRRTPRAEAKEVRSAIVSGQIIASSVKSGRGALVVTGRAHSGAVIPRALVVEALGSCARGDIAPPARSARAQLGEAMKALNGNGLVTRSVPSTSRPDGVAVRWIVGVVDASEAVSLGTKTLIVDLMVTDLLRFDRPESPLAQRVRDAYESRCTGETYSATVLLAWFDSVLKGAHHAADCDGVRYVPGGEVDAVRALVDAMRPILGRGIRVIGVATEDDIRDGLVSGLSDEVSEIRTRYLRETERARNENRTGIGMRMATTMLGELQDTWERVEGYTAILGSLATARIRATCDAIEESLSAALEAARYSGEYA